MGSDKPHIHTYITRKLASLPEEMDLEQVAEIADRIYDSDPQKGVYSTSDSTPTGICSNRMLCIENNMEVLTIQLKNIMRRQNNQNFPGSRTDIGKRSKSPHRSRNQSNFFPGVPININA